MILLQTSVSASNWHNGCPANLGRYKSPDLYLAGIIISERTTLCHITQRSFGAPDLAILTESSICSQTIWLPSTTVTSRIVRYYSYAFATHCLFIKSLTKVQQWAVNSQDWWDDDNYESAYELATFLHKCGLDMAETTTPHYFSTLEIFLLYPNWEPYLPSLSNYWQSSKAADDFDELALTKPTVPTATIRFTDFPRFSAFQPTIQPNFYGITLTERVYTWLIYDIVDPKSFRKIVRGNESITRNDAVELAESHINLLGLAVRSFVQSRFIPWYNQSTWNELMHELVLTIGDVSLVQEDYIHYDIFENQHQMSYGNPLMVCIFSAVYTFFYAEFKSRKRSFERHLHTEVMKWLQILQDCSINLESYGQHEHGMIFRKDNRRRLLGYHEVWVWTGFSLGPNPSDWVFHLDRVVERFSGDFWRLIDNPVQHVPGAWDDTDREFFVTYRGEVLYRDIFKSELEDDSEDD